MTAGGLVYIIRAAPAENFIPTFGKNAFVTLVFCPASEFIIVGELSVTENFGGDAE